VPIEDVAGTVKDLIRAHVARPPGLRRSAAHMPSNRSRRYRTSTQFCGGSRRWQSCRRLRSWGSAWLPTLPWAAAFSPAR
jgi:hypothetical protein